VQPQNNTELELAAVKGGPRVMLGMLRYALGMERAEPEQMRCSVSVILDQLGTVSRFITSGAGEAGTDTRCGSHSVHAPPPLESQLLFCKSRAAGEAGSSH
jgi:hypothetical protein